jgi:hypothetical protein
VAAERRQSEREREEVGISGAHGGVAEQQLRLLPIGLVDQLDAPALGRDRLAQLQRVRLRGGPGREGLEGSLERGRQRVGIDVAREREHHVLADEVTAKMRADLLGARRFDRRRHAVGGVPVGMIGVQVADKKPCGQRAIVVAKLVDLADHLAAGALQLRRREVRPHQHVRHQRQIGVQVARQHLALEARRVGHRRDVQRGAQRVQRRIHVLARLAAGAMPGPLGRQVGQPLAMARIGGRARTRRDDHVHERDGPVALDE